MVKTFKIFKLICIVAIIAMLTGCWDYKDINDRSIAITIGVDYTPEGNIQFVSENARLVPKSDKGGETAGMSGVYTISSQGSSFEKARQDFDSKIPYEDFSGAIRAVVLGRDFAKRGISSYLNRVDKLYGYRKAVLVVVSRENPSELIQTKVLNEVAVGVSIQNTLTYLSEQGAATYRNLGKILSDISFYETGYLLPYIGSEGNTIAFLGFAVMKESKLIDTVYSEDGLGILLLTSKNASFTDTIPHPSSGKDMLSVKNSLTKKKIKTSFVNGKPVINVTLKLDSQLQYQYYYSTPVDIDVFKLLEKTISENTKKKVEEIIKKTQMEYKCDIFQFAQYFQADHPKIFKQLDWIQVYPEAEIKVNVETKIRNINFLDSKALPAQ